MFNNCLYDEQNQIVSVSWAGGIISVGDRVMSSGRIFAKLGRWGTVVRIAEPYSNLHSSDVFYVMWDGDTEAYSMKFEDFLYVTDKLPSSTIH